MNSIAGWDYDKPTEQDLLAHFGTVMGARVAGAVWAAVCDDLALPRPVTDLSDLLRVTDAAMELGQELRVAGRSSRVRLITYRALSSTT